MDRQDCTERKVDLYPDALDVAHLEVALDRLDIVVDGKRLGLFYLQAHEDTLLIADFQVRHDLRGQGYGTAALNRLISLARSAGYSLITGFIQWSDWDRVEELSSFYRKRGFAVGEPDPINLRATLAMQL
jgi:GNAT superfamily N-acetyltransferase